MSATTVHLYGTLKVSFDGHVALVTLNRPKALNALNHALVVELDEVLHEITERFFTYDVNRDGRMDARELHNALNDYGLTATRAEVGAASSRGNSEQSF